MKKYFLSAVVSLLFFGCGPSIPHIVKDPTENMGPLSKGDKATVVFLRIGLGSAIAINSMPFALYDDEKIIGVVKSKNCSIYAAAPGKHLFNAFIKKGPLMDGRSRYMFIDAELAPGKEYYILVRPYVIAFAGLFTDLEPIRPGNEHWNNLPEWLADCAWTDINDETRAWDKEVAKDFKKERSKDFDDWMKDEAKPKKSIKPKDGLAAAIAPGKNTAK